MVKDQITKITKLMVKLDDKYNKAHLKHTTKRNRMEKKYDKLAGKRREYLRMLYPIGTLEETLDHVENSLDTEYERRLNRRVGRRICKRKEVN